MVSTVMLLKTDILWDVTLYRWTSIGWPFEVLFNLRNVGKYSPKNTKLRPRTLASNQGALNPEKYRGSNPRKKKCGYFSFRTREQRDYQTGNENCSSFEDVCSVFQT
jgi:hypothetical protein